VADLELETTWRLDFVNGGGGRKSLKVLTVEIKVIFFSLFWPYFYYFFLNKLHAKPAICFINLVFKA